MFFLNAEFTSCFFFQIGSIAACVIKCLAQQTKQKILSFKYLIIASFHCNFSKSVFCTCITSFQGNAKHISEEINQVNELELLHFHAEDQFTPHTLLLGR